RAMGATRGAGSVVSRHAALRLLVRVCMPESGVPRAMGAGGFALLRSQVYATVLTGAETGHRPGVMADRKADVPETWLREHPGAGMVCRDGSGAYGNSRELHLTGDVCPV